MEVPVEVLEAAKGLVDEFGSSFKYLGKYEGKDAFVFVFPDLTPYGFPFVYLYEKGKPVEKITGFDVLDIVCSFHK